MRPLLTFVLAASLTACGPFRAPAFNASVAVSQAESGCVARIEGSWPNLPHNPAEWFHGGRTSLAVLVYSPATSGHFRSDQIAVYYAFAGTSPYKDSILSGGYVAYGSGTLTVDLEETSAGTPTKAAFNGRYTISNQAACKQ